MGFELKEDISRDGKTKTFIYYPTPEHAWLTSLEIFAGDYPSVAIDVAVGREDKLVELSGLKELFEPGYMEQNDKFKEFGEKDFHTVHVKVGPGTHRVLRNIGLPADIQHSALKKLEELSQRTRG